MLHNNAAAGPPLPRNFRAPSLRFSPNRSLDFATASLTNVRLPITAPSVKYLTRQRSILANGTSSVARTSCPTPICSRNPFLKIYISTFPSRVTRSSDFSTAFPISIFR
jgi:hypothetical protein